LPMATELKPCPLCGCEKSEACYSEIGYAVYCDKCGARGPLAKTKADAIAAWNRRADDDNFKSMKKRIAIQATAELVDALRDLYDEQNDAPLERRRPEWQAAMDNAIKVLEKYEK
jgi:Lar family restriction alleviation protein